MAYLVISNRSAADRTLLVATSNRQQPVCDIILKNCSNGQPVPKARKKSIASTKATLVPNVCIEPKIKLL